jgi:UPF0755 protein
VFKKIIISTLIFLLPFLYAFYLLQAPLNIPENTTIEVLSGQTLGHVDRKLTQQKILPAAKILTLYMRAIGMEKSLKAGEYALPTNTNIIMLADILVSGKSIEYQVTLVEGLTIKEVLIHLNTVETLMSDVSIDQLPSLMEQLGQSVNPEGMFYPDTYNYVKGTKVSSLLKQSNEKLERVLAQEWDGREKNLPYKNAYEALIMASIVEKETGQPNERSEIAGVFVRRLNKRMRLQTDPTVIYGLFDEYKGNITRKHLRQYTPYNTYKIPALPPTPIALAGREAIRAALHPKKGESIYFVAKGDGSHYFSSTLAEHQKAVQKYQIRSRKQNYQSAPTQ